jgi:hypothetical protein
MAPEIFYGIGALVLLAALIWATLQYRARNRTNDPVTEEATRELFEKPGSYDKSKHDRDLKPS